MHRNYVPHILVGIFLFGFFCSNFSDFLFGPSVVRRPAQLVLDLFHHADGLRVRVAQIISPQ